MHLRLNRPLKVFYLWPKKEKKAIIEITTKYQNICTKVQKQKRDRVVLAFKGLMH